MPPQSLPVDDQAGREALVDLYRRDRHNHIYALADLAEPFWSRSRWWRRGDAAVGLIGLGDDEFVVYAVNSYFLHVTLLSKQLRTKQQIRLILRSLR